MFICISVYMYILYPYNPPPQRQRVSKSLKPRQSGSFSFHFPFPVPLGSPFSLSPKPQSVNPKSQTLDVLTYTSSPLYNNPKGSLNFLGVVRAQGTVPLELVIQGFDIHHRPRPGFFLAGLLRKDPLKT